ncbi:MAG: 3-methylcrotonyl-CoA carboxylase [Gammaproteobacteria bacterium CG22_combo_CG10-13_8_21_14_all_40_8]|nr:MAG: 3-methylcrotonyl-CoA carboxylase [Gammaproteobacteria bacterium CG22_combo_CG10-13_8_21_14_all_40_8]
MSLNKILIANRGEIACRIIKTAKRLGIKTVAIYSDFDKDSLHTQMADEAYHIGGSATKDSYLCMDKILQVAKTSGADAVHPGYGFLSENAQFARDCAKANIIFIGPPVAAIEAMGSKSAAKEIMQKAGVPLVQGYHGDNQTPEFLKQKAVEIGFPVLLKASAGGGGKGMRIVENEANFLEQLSSCQREALSSFGDDNILIEKYLTKPRHVEIQVFADKHEHQVHLFERDCSIQRRHQKVIEEAPAPNIPDAVRNKLGAVAIQAAKAIGYEGAGTVEFLYDIDNRFYFMEMNTRLQVEHPVTEMITGVDLVEWQILVAAGEPLPLQQHEIQANGHAFEVRIYAEDPSHDFLPAIGKIQHLQFPRVNDHVRIDSGIVEGDTIGIFYDPMIAKLIVWDQNRTRALSRLNRALEDCKIAGLTTNIDFLKAIAGNASFKATALDTGFIERESTRLFQAPVSAEPQTIILASLFLMLKRSSTHQKQIINHDANSPWSMNNGWRLNKKNYHPLVFVEERGDEHLQHEVMVHFCHQGFDMEYAQQSFHVEGHLDAHDQLNFNINGYQSHVHAVQIAYQLTLFSATQKFIFNLPILDNEQDAHDESKLTAPMPGAIIKVFAKAGDKVNAGDALLIMEAMKMEHTITAPFAGTVVEVFFSQGEQVAEGIELIELEADIEK